MITITEFKDFIGNDLAAAIIIFVAFLVLSKLVVFIIEKFLMRLAKKTETLIDDLILEIIHKPIFFVVILAGILISLAVLGYNSGSHAVLYNIVYSVLVIILAYLASKIFNLFIEHWGRKFAKQTKSKVDDQLVKLFEGIGYVIVWAFAVIFVFQIWNINVGPFITSLGIAGVAVAFALQSSLGNIFGGVSLILDKSIRVGDVVELEDKTSGTVLYVGIRSTKIKTWNNEVLIIPNGKLADAKIVNYVQPEEKVRVVIPFSVAYGSDIAEVKKIILEQIPKIENFIPDPEPMVIFMEMANSSLNFNAYFYVTSYSKRFASKDAANTLIYNALNENNISIPFPQMDVHVKSEESGIKKSKVDKKAVAKNVRKPTVKNNIKR